MQDELLLQLLGPGHDLEEFFIANATRQVGLLCRRMIVLIGNHRMIFMMVSKLLILQ